MRTSPFVILLVGQCVAVSRSAGQDAPGKGTAEPLALVRQANADAKKALRSGQGEGLYEVWVKKAGANDFELTVKAATTIAFDQDKYYVRLQYDVSKGRPSITRIIINDRKELASSWFSPLVHPQGAVGEIFAAKQPDDSPSTAGFQFDPSEPRIANLEQLLAYYRAVSWKPKGDGRYVGVTAPKEGITHKLWASQANGYNIDRHVIIVGGDPEPYREWNVKWKIMGSVWVPERWEEVTLLPGHDTQRYVFTYKSFTPNAVVPLVLFARESLGLPPGARTIDRRPPAQRPPPRP
jgi:hypothetical protein